LQTLHRGANFLEEIINKIVNPKELIDILRSEVDSLMEILEANDPICSINCELDSFQTFATDETTKTRWMIRLAIGSQNPFRDSLSADATFF
jgi:hypothetical protein